MSSPTVSVIVPNYRHAAYLPERLDSILNQTYQDFELILLDDASPDDSRSILDAYAARDPTRIRTLYNEQNSGSAFAQWNKGVAAARGTYCWIAESDDVAEPALLETLVAGLESDPQIVVAYGRSRWIDAKSAFTGDAMTLVRERCGGTWECDITAQGHAFIRNYMLTGNPIQNASAAIFRKSRAYEIGIADLSMRICGDWKWWGQMIGGPGCSVKYYAKQLNRFRRHAATARQEQGASVRELQESLQVIRTLLTLLPYEVERLNLGFYLGQYERIMLKEGSDVRRNYNSAVVTLLDELGYQRQRRRIDRRQKIRGYAKYLQKRIRSNRVRPKL